MMTTQQPTRLKELAYPVLAQTTRVDWDDHAAQVTSRVIKALSGFQPIRLEDLEPYALMNRTDTKFVFHANTLVQALETLSDSYRVLQVVGNRVHKYQNLYFDTPRLDAFIEHHRQQRDRYKVRSRAYVGTGRTFLEVKRKNNQDYTIKQRLETSSFVEALTDPTQDFLAGTYPGDPSKLQPVLWNEFERITLVSTTRMERLTLDINLNFSEGWNLIGLPGVAVAEVKQQKFSTRSDFFRQMRALGVLPRRFSKYCMGIPLFYSGIKTNRFRPRVLLIEKIINQGGWHGHHH